MMMLFIYGKETRPLNVNPDLRSYTVDLNCFCFAIGYLLHFPVIPFSLMLYIILVSRMMANDNLHAFSSYTLCYTRSVMCLVDLFALDLLFCREA